MSEELKQYSVKVMQQGTEIPVSAGITAMDVQHAKESAAKMLDEAVHPGFDKQQEVTLTITENKSGNSETFTGTIDTLAGRNRTQS